MDYLLSEIDDLDVIIIYWNDTYEYRMTLLDGIGEDMITTSQYFEKVAFLKEPEGYKLVIIKITNLINF